VAAAEPPGEARFQILGPLEVRAAGGWAPVRGPRQRWLLAMLLLAGGQPVSRNRLIAEAEGGGLSGRSTISVQMHRLRALLGDQAGRLLVARPEGYQLVLAPGALDADRFASLAARGRQALEENTPDRAADLLAQALRLWRGPALGAVPATPLITGEADRLEESRLAVLELRVIADLRCGRVDHLVPELRRILIDHPLREGIWLLLLQALEAAGRHAEAIEAYGQARAALTDELGVSPGRELRQIYEQLLAANAVSTWPPPARPRPVATAGARGGHGSALRSPAAGKPPAAAGPPAAHPDARPGELIGDVPGYECCPDPLTAQTPADFAEVLRQFRAWAGDPSYRAMAEEAARCSRKAAASTLSQAANSGELPTQRVALAFVAGCGGTQEHLQAFATAWRRLRLSRSPRPQPDQSNPLLDI
jgi:DNA-binding SARP family transcriptional activator